MKRSKNPNHYIRRINARLAKIAKLAEEIEQLSGALYWLLHSEKPKPPNRASRKH